MPNPSRSIASLLSLGWMIAAAPLAAGESAAEPAASDGKTAWGERIVVTATRADETLAEVPLHASVLEREEIDAGPEYGAIDVVRRLPNLALQGTESTLIASPVDGGAAFRGLGGTAQSRILLMVDSSPVNDPYASYLIWSRVPTEEIERIEVLPGSVGSWGNLALTGVVNVITRGASDRRWSARLEAGNLGTVSAGGDWADAGRKWSGWISGNGLDTDGYYLLPRAALAPIDEPASKRFGTLYGRLDRSLSSDSSLRAHVTVFEEDRRRGTRRTLEESTEEALTLTWDRVVSRRAGVQVHAFARSVGLEELQPAENDDRTAETPDQVLRVPSEAQGASAVWRLLWRERHSLRLGADAQRIAVDSTRLYAWDGTRLTRAVDTAGEQRFLGAFVQDTVTLSERTTLTLGGRFDRISTRAGRRVERDRTTGETIAVEDIPDATETHFNPSLAIALAVRPDLRLRSAVYTGFRAGTPNELFVDSVGRNRNLSNPRLEPEKLTGAEIGVDWSRGRRAATRVTAYWSESRDLIERIEIGRAGPEGGVVPPCGLLQPGARCRQRRNIGEVRVVGLEAEQEVRFGERWLAHVFGSWLDSEVIDSKGNPSVIGNSVLRTADRTATATLRYTGERFDGAVRLRYLGERWNDADNTERLPAQTVLDLSLDRQIGRGWELTAGVQNVLDDRWTVNYSGDFPELSTPRLLHVGLRFRSR